MYFRTCPFCGSHLDPGEKCECQIEKTVVDRLREDYKPNSEPTKEEALWKAFGLVRS